MAAYRQAGADGLTWIEGDYAFVLWDAREQRMFAVRDPQGGFPLYWIHDGDAIAVSNAMRPLVDVLPHRRLDRDYVAEYLMLPGTGVQEVNDEHCAYEGVHRVLAGTRLEVRPGGQAKLVRWWDWLDQIEEPGSLQHEAIAARFGELFADAVRQRQVGRTAAHLSGGMDSTAVALLLARNAREAGDEPIHGLSLVYERFSFLARERPFVECALGESGLKSHLLSGDEHLGFEGYRDDVNSDEPALVLYQSTSNQAMLRHAADLGAHTLMTGLGADELIGQPAFHLHELLRRGRWLAAWRRVGPLGQRGQQQPLELSRHVRVEAAVPCPIAGRAALLVARRAGSVGRAVRVYGRSLGPFGIRPPLRTVESGRRATPSSDPPLPAFGPVADIGISGLKRRGRLALVDGRSARHLDGSSFSRPAAGTILPGVSRPHLGGPDAAEADSGRRHSGLAPTGDLRAPSQRPFQRDFLCRPFAESPGAGGLGSQLRRGR